MFSLDIERVRIGLRLLRTIGSAIKTWRNIRTLIDTITHELGDDTFHGLATLGAIPFEKVVQCSRQTTNEDTSALLSRHVTLISKTTGDQPETSSSFAENASTSLWESLVPVAGERPVVFQTCASR